MNKLLKFFIPKTTIEILKFFGFALVIVAAIQFLPIESDTKSIFSVIVLLFLFPLVSYFNNVMYLPTSLDWILLAPVKKFHIVLAHGLLNIFKIALMLLLAILFLSLYNLELITKPLEFLLVSDGPQTFNRTSVHEFLTWVMIIGSSVLFIFGILPNYVQSVQQRQNYHVKKTVKEKGKTYLVAFGFLIFVFLFLSESGEAETYLPWFLRASLIIVLFLFGAIYSTLSSLRFYFSKKKFNAVAAGAFVLVSFLLHTYASMDITSRNLHLIEKIESLDFLGSYSSGLEKVIDAELLASGPSLSKIAFRDLKPFIERSGRADLNLELLRKWEIICKLRNDYTCRLAYHVQWFSTKGKATPEILRQACPSDLGSCLILYDRKDIPLAEQQLAAQTLTSRCENNKNEFEITFCKRFKSLERKKKK